MTKAAAPPTAAVAAATAVSIRQLLAFADGPDIALMVVGGLAAAASGLIYPLFVLRFGQFVDFANSEESVILHKVRQISLFMVGLGAVALVCGFLSVACWVAAGERQALRMKVACVRATVNQDPAWLDANPVGQLPGTITASIAAVQGGLGRKAAEVIMYTASLVGSLAIGIAVNPTMAGVTLASIPIIVAGVALDAGINARCQREEQEHYGKAGAIAYESITGIRAVAAQCGEAYEMDRYGAHVGAAYRVGVRSGPMLGLGYALLHGAFQIAYTGIFSYALVQVANQVEDGCTDADHCFTGGDVMTTFICILRAAATVSPLVESVGAVSGARAAAVPIFDMLSRKPAIDAYSAEGSTLEAPRGALSIEDVTFAYPSRPEEVVYQGLSLEIAAGESVALVGRSGSGKSTLVKLLLRQYDPSGGCLRLDGADIRTLNVAWYRRVVGYVGQEVVLFSGTVRDNIAFGRPGATHEDVVAAAQAADAHDFIMKFSAGYNTDVGEAGAQLSGGQKQRLAIARAFIKNPAVLLLDEATSALDTESERAVQAVLDATRALSHLTSITVAHRLSTVRSCDRIAVIEGGGIAEIGTHDTLVEQGGLYHALLTAQERPADSSELQIEVGPIGVAPKPAHRSRQHKKSASLTSGHAPQASQSASNRNTWSAARPGRTHNRTNASQAATEEFLARLRLVGVQVPRPALCEGYPGAYPGNRPPSFQRSMLASGQLSSMLVPVSSMPDFASARATNDSDSGGGGGASSGGTRPSSLTTCYFSCAASQGTRLSTKSMQSQLQQMPQAVLGGRGHRDLWALARNDWPWLVVGGAGAVLLGLKPAAEGIVLGNIQQALFLATSDAILTRGCKWLIGFAALLGVVLIGGMALCVGFTQSGARCTKRVRESTFCAVLRQGMDWFDQHPTGEVLVMLEADAANISKASGIVQGRRMQLVVTVVAGVITALVVAWRIALVVLAEIPILAGNLLIGFFVGRLSSSEGLSERRAAAGRILVDALLAIPTLQALNLQEHMCARFAEASAAVTAHNVRLGLLAAVSFGYTQAMIPWAGALIFWFGANSVVDGELSPTDFFISVYVLCQAFSCAGQVDAGAGAQQEGADAAQRVLQLCATKSKVDPLSEAGAQPGGARGAIRFERVSFCYPTRPDALVLGRLAGAAERPAGYFDLRVEAGQCVALVGASGTGKSTAVQLLLRFYDPLEGKVELDGRDVRELNVHWLRSQIGYVGQDPVLFAGTIRENIVRGRKQATTREVEAAAHAAHAHEFITALPDGYDTDVGEKSKMLSGGQRQRIAIARAIISDPAILVLDEATSALDNECEKQVQDAMEALQRLKRRTTVMIAHRLSTVRNADTIAVISDGCIVEQGTHTELLSNPESIYSGLLREAPPSVRGSLVDSDSASTVTATTT